VRYLERRWLVAVVIAVIAVGILVWQTFFNKPPAECGAVRDLLDFNHSQAQIIEKKTGDGALPLADYQLWADGMTQRAGQVDGEMSPDALRLAELATQFVTKLPQVQNPAPGEKAPPAVYQMSALNDQITREIKTLSDKCPAS
jgi:hypothetical protein